MSVLGYKWWVESRWKWFAASHPCKGGTAPKAEPWEWFSRISLCGRNGQKSPQGAQQCPASQGVLQPSQLRGNVLLDQCSHLRKEETEVRRGAGKGRGPEPPNSISKSSLPLPCKGGLREQILNQLAPVWILAHTERQLAGTGGERWDKPGLTSAAA